MSKRTERSEVESAIRGLYDLFQSPPGRHSCRNVRTRKVAEIEKKIKSREEDLKKDSKLVKLQAELVTARKEGLEAATRLHRGVDDLLRRFQLRGVSDELIRDIEKLAKEQPVLIDEDCE